VYDSNDRAPLVSGALRRVRKRLRAGRR
jgi:hypothetical protein